MQIILISSRTLGASELLCSSLFSLACFFLVVCFLAVIVDVFEVLLHSPLHLLLLSIAAIRLSPLSSLLVLVVALESCGSFIADPALPSAEAPSRGG